MLRRTAEESVGPSAIARLSEPLQPIHRAELYENELERALLQHAPGCRITGGGVMTLATGEPLYADIELCLGDNVDSAVFVIVDVLQYLGAPRGSRLIVEGREPVPFGRTLGVGVYLNGTDLPEEVYETNDVNDLIDSLIEAVNPTGGCLHSWWEGPLETALYFFGEDREALRVAITSETSRHALADGCRILDLALEGPSY